MCNDGNNFVDWNKPPIYDVYPDEEPGIKLIEDEFGAASELPGFWDWSWQEMALYDLIKMIHYINALTNIKIFIVEHSHGTVNMSLTAFTQLDIAEMVEAAALPCPISYLDHVTAPLVLGMVEVHLDQMIAGIGIHQLNFRSQFGIQLVDSKCAGHIECNNFLASITGKNCCFNNSRVDYDFVGNEQILSRCDSKYILNFYLRVRVKVSWLVHFEWSLSMKRIEESKYSKYLFKWNGRHQHLLDEDPLNSRSNSLQDGENDAVYRFKTIKVLNNAIYFQLRF